MRKSLFFTLLAALVCTGLYAQNFMMIDSEKVFKASAAYNQAISQLDKMAQDHQKKIDDTYAEIEQTYNTYQTQKQYLSVQARQAREDAIINKEKEVNKYQEDVFGTEGSLMKKRVEVIKPIQDKIFEIINDYAKRNNFQLVLDIATSPNVLFYSPTINKTEQIIALIK